MPTSVLSKLSGNWSAKKDPGKLSQEQARPWSHASSTSASSDSSGDESGIDEKDTGIDEGIEEYNSGIEENNSSINEGQDPKDSRNKNKNRIYEVDWPNGDGTYQKVIIDLSDDDSDTRQPKKPEAEKTEAEKEAEYRQAILDHRKHWEDKLISFLKNCDIARIFNEWDTTHDKKQIDGETFTTYLFLDLFFRELGYVDGEAKNPKTSRSVTQMFGEWLGEAYCALALCGQYKGSLIDHTLRESIIDRIADLGFDDKQLDDITQYQKQYMIRQLSLATIQSQEQIQNHSEDSAKVAKIKVNKTKKLGLYHNSKHYLSNIVFSSLFHSNETRTPFGKCPNPQHFADFYDTQMRRIINEQPIQEPREFFKHYSTRPHP